jgi:hypothetical protein
MFIGEQTDVHSESYISFNVNTRKEAESLLSYLQTRFANFLLKLRKITHNISENTCKWIPLPPLNKEWTDEDVYKHYKLSEDDIKLINETNIVGYKSIVKQPKDQVETAAKRPLKIKFNVEEDDHNTQPSEPVVAVEEVNPKKIVKRKVKLVVEV